ncbi:MAG: TIGR00269 family protein [Promethearchaeia archaeon]
MNRSNYQIHLKLDECTQCGKSPVIEQRYSDRNLCRSCFIESIENRIKRMISRSKLWTPEDQLIIGLSGGKDSIALLYNLNKLLLNNDNLNSITALIIDEGIKGYRDKSVEFAKAFCEKLDVEYKIISFRRRVGMTLDEIIKTMKGKENKRYSCNYCAIIRRRLLNEGAKELKGTVLAMGHNLTDIAETYLMNILYKRFYLIGNQYIFRERSKTLKKYYVKKITPLMHIPEEEIFLYCNLKNLRYYRSHCPYREEEPITRKKVLQIIQRLKNLVPEIEYNLLESFLRLSKILYKNRDKIKPQVNYNFCKNCGYPCSNGKTCTYCKYIEKFT